MPVELRLRSFSALLPVLRHGAIGADSVPELEPCLISRLASAFPGTGIRQFVADARDVSKERRLALRTGDVLLQTENPLTAGFSPPSAKDVEPALGIALRSINAALDRDQGDFRKAAICALLGSQILLTIHPFRDGNGRTARMFFAAKVLRHIGPSPSVLLGLLLIHRAGGHQYHQAAWAFRAGDVEPMLGLFVSSVRLAAEQLLPNAQAEMPPEVLLEHCWSGLRKWL